jgi:hypothetical protein
MRSTRHRVIRAVVAATVLAALSGCREDPFPQAGAVSPQVGGAEVEPAPPEQPVPLPVDRHRESDGVVAEGGRDAVYNYAPAVMREDGTVRMWWCSQYSSAPPPGDDVLYAQAATVDGPFTGPGGGEPVSVLSGNPGRFDAVHTCDPSVVKVEGTYYLYYTGAAGDHALGNAIGLATSTDGVNWSRANGGEPILTPSHDTHRDNVYGAGQPAVVYLDGWFYLMFTDTTGSAAGWNGAGQFMLRSRDAAFASGVEALGVDGFAPVPGTSAPRTVSLVDAFSADLMWVDALGAFAIAHETEDGTTVTFWNRDFSANPYQPILVPGPWQEGPGLLRAPDGHAPVSERDPCGRVPFDVVRATVIGSADAPTDLRHFGLDVYGIEGCDTAARASVVLDGFAVPSPERTMDLVNDGTVVRVDRRSVASALAEHVLDERPAVLDNLPVVARLTSGTPAVRTPGGDVALLLDDGRLWPVNVPGVAELNGSAVLPVADRQWDRYEVGPTLG